jgi:hypothetical protein
LVLREHALSSFPTFRGGRLKLLWRILWSPTSHSRSPNNFHFPLVLDLLSLKEDETGQPDNTQKEEEEQEE